MTMTYEHPPMTDVIFEQPPMPSAGGRGEASRVPGTIGVWLHELRDATADMDDRPWARFPEPRNATYSARIRRGEYSRTLPGEFDVVTRRTDGDGQRAPDNKVWLYVKYIGASDD
jgi:hypothetical protein